MRVAKQFRLVPVQTIAFLANLRVVLAHVLTLIIELDSVIGGRRFSSV